MANVDSAFGFKYVNSLGGYCVPARRYFIPSTDSTAVFVGDPVKLAGSADGQGIATVAQAAAGDKVVGVVVGVDQVRDVGDANFSLYRTYRPASIGMYVWVIDDPNAIFEIQADDDSATLAATDIGLNADFIVGSGSTVNGVSGVELDTSTKATTSTLGLRIQGLVQRPDNEKFVANQKVLVMFNKHAYKTGYDTGATAEIGGLGV